MKSDRGNAVIEFIALGLIAQLILFGFMIRLGSDFRSELAASSIARQTLRALQLTGSEAEALDIAERVGVTFGIPADARGVSISNTCAQQGAVQVSVKVRGKVHVAKGFCLF